MKLPELWVTYLIGILMGFVLFSYLGVSLRWSLALGFIGGFLFSFIDRGLRGSSYEHSRINAEVHHEEIDPRFSHPNDDVIETQTWEVFNKV